MLEIFLLLPNVFQLQSCILFLLVVKERESFNKQMEKDNPAKNWQPFRVAPVNRAEAIDFRAEMEKVKLFN